MFNKPSITNRFLYRLNKATPRLDELKNANTTIANSKFLEYPFIVSLFSFHKIIVLFCLFLFTKTIGFSQNLWDDKAYIDTIKAGIQANYNFEFEKAEAIRDLVLAKYPDHPAGLMFDALILYWKYYPLLSDSEEGKRFESVLLKTIDASELEVHKMPDHQLTRFFAMMPRLMLLQFYSDNGLAFRGVPHLTSVYRSVTNGFTFKQTTPEFNFTTGLYNYYREAYPESNPFFKPIVYFFPDGNKEEGLSELYQCWQLSDFIGPEAMLFLSYIYINFETNYGNGVKYALELTQRYPKNPLFAEYYIQLLLLNKQYAKAEKVVDSIKEDKTLSVYFKVTVSVYEAIINEQKQNNLTLSENKYHSAISSIKSYGNYSKRYLAYAYFGLSRIYQRKGLISQSDKYKSLAKSTAQYPHVSFD